MAHYIPLRRPAPVIEPPVDPGFAIDIPVATGRGNVGGGLGLVAGRFGASTVQHGASTGLEGERVSVQVPPFPGPTDQGGGFSKVPPAETETEPPPASDYNYDPSGRIYGGVVSAVTSAFSDVSKGNTAGTIDWKINQSLAGLNLTPDQLAAVQAGESAAEPHGAGFWERGGNPAPFVSSWVSNIVRALTNAKPASADAGAATGGVPPPPQQGTDNPTGTSTNDPAQATTTAGMSQTATDLAGLLGAETGVPTGAASGGGSTGDPLANLPPTVQAVGGSSGPNPLLYILLLAGVGGAWYYMAHRKHPKPSQEQAA